MRAFYIIADVPQGSVLSSFSTWMVFFPLLRMIFTLKPMTVPLTLIYISYELSKYFKYRFTLTGLCLNQCCSFFLIHCSNNDQIYMGVHWLGNLASFNLVFLISQDDISWNNPISSLWLQKGQAFASKLKNNPQSLIYWPLLYPKVGHF